MKKIVSILVLAALSAGPSWAAGGIGALFSSILGYGVGNAVDKAVVENQAVEKALVKLAGLLNKNMPMYPDKETRADNVTAGPGKLLTFNYTMLTTTAKNVSLEKASVPKIFQETVKPQVCAMPDMQAFYKNGVTLIYSYRSVEGLPIAKMNLMPKDCGYAN